MKWKKNLDSSTEWAVWKRQDELLEATAVNKTKSGVVRHYLTKSASYKEVDNYLDCLINAMYDVCGFCF